MDSGNSGSLQSSSGDDGGVATATTITTTTTGGSIDSMYLNTSTYFNPIPNLQPHHHHQQQQPPSTFFNPTSFSQPITQNSNPMYNLDSLWLRNPNPDPFSNLDHSHQDPIFDLNPENPLHKSQNPETTPAKNPKKRTRASRRASTIVLTTDTTNFRQMVQEFTGIPAAPFATSSSSSSPFSLRRDLLRPSAQKIQLNQNQPSYLNNNSTTTSNFHLTPSDMQNFTIQPLNLSSLSNLQNLQNQMFPFQGTSQTAVPRQGDGSEGENQPEAQNVGLGSSLKRWRSENENVSNFEGGNGNIHNTGVGSSRSDGDQNQLPAGNEDSWICPSD